MPTIETVELKGIKIASNMSEETVAFTGSLYINGKKAADLKNDGNGGATLMWFTDQKLSREFDAYCEDLPPVPPDDWNIKNGFGPTTMSAELWVSIEIGKIDEARYWKRKCAKTMCVILKSHQVGQFTQYKAWPYSPEAAKEVRGIHGTDLLEIVNERYL